MKLYVAGSWDDRKVISLYIDEFKKLGYEITFDWTKVEKTHDSNLSEYAVNDVNGVRNADVLIIFITDRNYAYRGTTTELGIALGLNKKIVICNLIPDSAFLHNIFVHHPNIRHVNTWIQLMEIISA